MVHVTTDESMKIRRNRDSHSAGKRFASEHLKHHDAVCYFDGSQPRQMRFEPQQALQTLQKPFTSFDHIVPVSSDFGGECPPLSLVF